MNKRGDLSSTQLVVIILAIAGFAFGVMFLFGVFKNDSLTNRDLCKLSILSRATVPGVVQNAIPLDCFTEKICITTEKSFIENVKKKVRGTLSINSQAIINQKSDCKQFAGEENVREVKIKINKVDIESSRKIIEEEYANAMFDCWVMTGQGKLDVFRGTGSTTVSSSILEGLLPDLGHLIRTIKPQCLVCSRIVRIRC